MPEPNYAQIDHELTSYEGQLLPELRKVFGEAAGKTEALVVRRHGGGGLDFKFINGLELRGLGDLVPLLRSYLFRVYQAGESRVRDEFESKSYVDVLPPREAINYFENKAFTWKGILADELLAQIKRVLIGSLTAGSPVQTTLDSLREVFAPYAGNLSAIPDQEQFQPYRLETLLRTNTTEAYNQGRKAAFAGVPDVTGFRYSAILDTRTTPVCRYLHGKILPTEGEALEQLTPPRHYNCRSLLIPTTGLVQLVTPAEVQEGVNLSGRDFADVQEARVYGELSVIGGPMWEVCF